MCICLHVLKPKMRINQKVEKKMSSAERKTQRFEKSCVLGWGKKGVQNAHNLWTSGDPQIKTRCKRFVFLSLGACYYENAPKYIISSLTALTPPSHLSALHSAWSSSHASHLYALLYHLRGKSLCSVIRLSFFFFFFFFLSSSSSTRF